MLLDSKLIIIYGVCFIRELYILFWSMCVLCLLLCIHHYRNLEVLKQKQAELELLEVKLTQKSVDVAQERENNMAERQCVSVITPRQLMIVVTNVTWCII